MTASVVFPTALPIALRAGYGIKRQSSGVRTDMESGPPRKRRRFTTTVDRVTVSWHLSEAQLETFEDWYDTDAQGGNAWFSMRLRDGRGVRAMDCSFVEAYSIDLDGRGYRVTAELDVRDRRI